MNIIYKLTNKITGKSYIGMTINFQKRMNNHKSLSNKDNPKQHIHRSIKKYGWDNFDKEIIRNDIESKQMLEAAEIFYISFYDTYYNGYNMSKGGENNFGYIYGKEHSEAVKRGLNRVEENGKTVAQNSAARTVQYDRSGEKNPFYGKTHTDEVRKRIAKNSEKLTGLKKSAEHCKNISKSTKGKPKSEEHKQALREAHARQPLKTCPHCGKEGKGGNMTRYHFDNCKKLNKDGL